MCRGGQLFVVELVDEIRQRDAEIGREGFE